MDGRKERMGGCFELKERVEGRKVWMEKRRGWDDVVNGRKELKEERSG